MKFTTSNAVVAGVRVAVSLAICLSLMPMAQAQTFRVIHTFTGGADGANPQAGLTLDRAGNLYGTASNGGAGVGTVYRLKRSGSGWIFGVVHAFTDVPDGAYPVGGVIFGPDGALYGTTFSGGAYCNDYEGCGTVYRSTPPATFCRSVSCPWTESVVYPFQGGADGAFPLGDLTFDQQGDIYGTTNQGGALSGQCVDRLRTTVGCGTVYQLSISGNSWTHNVVYTFQGPRDSYADGVGPGSGVIFDGAGNLYGTTWMGGLGGYYGSGVVYELSFSGGSWSESLLHSFTGGNDGGNPYAGLIFDQAGNLYGATAHGGINGGGTAFQLTDLGGGWNLMGLYNFAGGYGSAASLTMDQAGNLYGTTAQDGAYGYGNVFELSLSNGIWSYQDLYDFTGGSDGGNSGSNVILDADGNLYGTASCGGDGSCWGGHGVVWEITR
jgi:uncharacterized repeat protein (TIGR03803 family)